jgi:DNA-binding XRE family transcriptional regulator
MMRAYKTTMRSKGSLPAEASYYEDPPAAMELAVGRWLPPMLWRRPPVLLQHSDEGGRASLPTMRLRGGLMRFGLPTNNTGGIRKLRETQGMTQEELARKAKVTQGYVSHLEKGLKKNPSLPTLKRLARALGVPVTELL